MVLQQTPNYIVSLRWPYDYSEPKLTGRWKYWVNNGDISIEITYSERRPFLFLFYKQTRLTTWIPECFISIKDISQPKGYIVFNCNEQE